MKYFLSLFVFVAISTIAFSQENQAKNQKVEVPVNQFLFVVDGKVLSPTNAIVVKDSTGSIITLNSIKSSEIQSVDVLKGDDAVEKYGDAAKNGVVVITTFASANKKH